MRRKRENEAPLKQESRRESNRLRMARLRALETVQEQETRKSNCLQMMQGRIPERVEDQEERLECVSKEYKTVQKLLSKDFIWFFQAKSNTEQAEQHCKIVQQAKQDLVLKLQDMLQRNNPYIKSFKSAIKKLGPDFHIIIHADKVPAGEHSRHFNESTTSEVAFIMDAVVSEGNVSDVGQWIILPSSFTGSPRYMHERTQDAMTYVRNYGRPDLFITFTCNPAWPEIANDLFLGQKPHNRHDLLATVFHGITKGKIFGIIQCYMYTTEWQKRGLPHAHILVWLQETLHVDKVDVFISAEIPNPDEDLELFSCITTQMIHGPCGVINPFSPCMKDGRCTKRYPRDFLKETQTGKDAYPLYRRKKPEDGGFSTVIKVRHSEVVVDNRWIVSYCPLHWCAKIKDETVFLI
ncbi:helitron_like_N domain-containing protein [Trichonephila clavipes]|nr:helitron_like_N domain-containing protein [Trichonephila clavipes]